MHVFIIILLWGYWPANGTSVFGYSSRAFLFVRRRRRYFIDWLCVWLYRRSILSEVHFIVDWMNQRRKKRRRRSRGSSSSFTYLLILAICHMSASITTISSFTVSSSFSISLQILLLLSPSRNHRTNWVIFTFTYRRPAVQIIRQISDLFA